MNEYCLVTGRTGRYYLSRERRDKIVSLMNSNNPPKMIEIDGNFISVMDISGIVNNDQILEVDNLKSGGYKCKYGHWHKRGEGCAHGGFIGGVASRKLIE